MTDPTRNRNDTPLPRLTTIGELAEATGLTLRAIRFYGDRGLLTPIRQGTARLFDAEGRRRAHRIVTLARFGFSLVEIKRLLAMSEAEAQPFLRERQAELDAEQRKLADDLRALQGEIQRIDRRAA